MKESYTEYIDQDSLCACAEAGNFEMMNWLLQENDFDFVWTSDLFSKAAKSGNIPIMELCFRNGCPTGESICSSAMQNKNDEACAALNLSNELGYEDFMSMNLPDATEVAELLEKHCD